MFIGKLLTLQPPPTLPHLTLRRNLRNVKTIITHKKNPPKSMNVRRFPLPHFLLKK